MAKNKVYMASFYKFGYDLTVAGHTKREAIESLMAEYVKTYKLQNDGNDPREDEKYWNPLDGKSISYYDDAKEDIEVREFEFGKVEWF